MDNKSYKNLFKDKVLRIDPIEKAKTIPSDWYHNEDIHVFEQQKLFKKKWLYVCHIDQIPEAGDSYTGEVAGNPIIIFRNTENELKAFYNVCKHRGGPLAIKKGTKTVLQCQYHGWTYLDDGSLRGIPDWNLVKLFDKKDFGLEPFEISIWQGLIFARVDTSDLELAQLLEGIEKRIAPLNLSTLKFHIEQVYEINCNWKVYVDNYLEGYHIPIVHPELANLLDYRSYVTETEKWHSLQHSPFKNGDNLYSKNGGEAFYYFVFPNMMLNILPGRLQMNLVIPVSPTRCKVIFSYFYDESETKKKSEIIKKDIAYSDDIQKEDIEICEAVQRGIQSKVYHQGRFSVKRELGVYHFQSLLKQEIKKSFCN
ncbi:MAG: aromatic ring-hydroxylating dioxygenase subunit alpha [Gracilimonas sp.]|uniref:aromatic ring-hydroxylating oxygenase subunit alpha n=1 Tax=Gracilimonas sp. TaxID=1974203 RepID=UPI00375129CA|nr:aromatic ring-hydroxylating dioxygenase subunit alpha [Gracilimonas sp.]